MLTQQKRFTHVANHNTVRIIDKNSLNKPSLATMKALPWPIKARRRQNHKAI
jgi:hypothetical protein